MLQGIKSGLQAFTSRSLHFKARQKAYPKVNVADVSLAKTRFGFRKERDPLLSLTVTDEVLPAEAIKQKYLDAGKPVPIKFKSRSDAIARRNLEKYRHEVAMGLPHFKLGEKKVYLPKARVCLLRPNAKHTPYQAKFLVPRNFNKMDLRDYLWHVYGLRALNVTVQLLHARFTRGANDHARYRMPQYKKMTIDMEEPFIWPELPADVVEKSQQLKRDQIEAIKMATAVGSDVHKPNDSFEGLYKKPQLPNTFVSKRLKRVLGAASARRDQLEQLRADRIAIAQALNL